MTTVGSATAKNCGTCTLTDGTSPPPQSTTSGPGRRTFHQTGAITAFIARTTTLDTLPLSMPIPKTTLITKKDFGHGIKIQVTATGDQAVLPGVFRRSLFRNETMPTCGLPTLPLPDRRDRPYSAGESCIDGRAASGEGTPEGQIIGCGLRLMTGPGCRKEAVSVLNGQDARGGHRRLTAKGSPKRVEVHKRT